MAFVSSVCLLLATCSLCRRSICSIGLDFVAYSLIVYALSLCVCFPLSVHGSFGGWGGGGGPGVNLICNLFIADDLSTIEILSVDLQS